MTTYFGKVLLFNTSHFLFQKLSKRCNSFLSYIKNDYLAAVMHSRGAQAWSALELEKNCRILYKIFIDFIYFLKLSYFSPWPICQFFLHLSFSPLGSVNFPFTIFVPLWINFLHLFLLSNGPHSDSSRKQNTPVWISTVRSQLPKLIANLISLMYSFLGLPIRPPMSTW